MLSLALGIPLAEVRKIPARDVQRYRRFYARQPFGPVRGDLNAWQIARNVGEMFGGRFRSPDKAVWGHTSGKHMREKDVKPKTDAENVMRSAQAAGVPVTPPGSAEGKEALRQFAEMFGIQKEEPDGGESVDR